MPLSRRGGKIEVASRAKRELVERVGKAVRKMGTQSVITSRTVADRFGMHMTDLEVLDLIFLRGQVSARGACGSHGPDLRVGARCLTKAASQHRAAPSSSR